MYLVYKARSWSPRPEGSAKRVLFICVKGSFPPSSPGPNVLEESQCSSCLCVCAHGKGRAKDELDNDFHFCESLFWCRHTACLFWGVHFRWAHHQESGSPDWLPSSPRGLAYQEFNTLLGRVIKSSHFRLISTLLIDLHFLFFHLKANTSLTVVTLELLIFAELLPALLSKLL